jgi:hypothetical protein
LSPLIKLVTGIAVLVAAIVALAPATLLDAPLAAATKQHLRLADATGPWWRGRGAIASADGTVRIPVRWNVDGAAILRGRLGVTIEGGDDAEARAALTIAAASLEVRELRVRVPAAMLVALEPRLKPLTLGGSIEIDAPSLSAAGDAVSGTLHAAWTNARIVTAEAIIDVGTVKLAANLSAHPATATISNAGGDVAVAGTIVGRAGAAEVDVVLRPAATASAAARNAVSMLGVPDGTGAVHVVWRASR